MEQYERILVGVEALEGVSYDAFEQACAMAEENDAALIIAFVIDKKGYAMLERMDPRGFERLKNEARMNLKKYEERAVDRGLSNVQTVLEIGDPSKMLVQDLCQKHEVDLIIVGKTGGTRIDRLMIGDKAKKVQKTSKCHVKVVSGEAIPPANA